MRQVKGDRVRRELAPGQSVELLKELHLVSRDGALHADSLRKLKQVNHLVQLIEPAIKDVLERHKEPVLVDAGAGNAYLGFVLYEPEEPVKSCRPRSKVTANYFEMCRDVTSAGG